MLLGSTYLTGALAARQLYAHSMETLWVTVGIVILALTLIDVFLTALNYDEAGFLAGRLAAWQWKALRSITRRLSRRWRPIALRQVTGLQIMVTIFAWIAGVTVGNGLIYYGSMHGKNFLFDGVSSGLFAAMYFSAAQLATVGTSQLSPNTDILRVLSIMETITGVILVSLILTFLLGVYQVISDLRALSAKFSSSSPGSANVAETLAPFFPNGKPAGIDRHLQGISDSLSSYTDGLRLHHAAYYFQSGRESFSLPFSMHMVSGTIGAFRWGLPTGHPSTQEPVLIQLGHQFDEFREYLHPLIGWQSTDVPETVDYTEFLAIMDTHAVPAPHEAATPTRLWALEFRWLNQDMARLTQSRQAPDPADAYRRYCQWLPFAYAARQATSAVSADLDYQPLMDLRPRTANRAADGAPRPVLPSVPTPKPEGDSTWWQRFWRRRVILIDPGMTRLLSALRAVVAALATALTLFAVFGAVGAESSSAALFGAMMAMSTSPGFGRRPRALGLIAIVPIGLAIGLSSIIPHSTVWTMAIMVILAMVSVGIGRLGKGLGQMGQLLFIAYYFTLLMHLRAVDLPQYLAAAGVGVAWAFVVNVLISRQSIDHVLKGGVMAFEQRLAMTLDPVIDAVAWSRWDPDINKRVRVDLRQMMRSAAFLGGQLRDAEPGQAADAEHAGILRQRIFDTELAMVNLIAAARNVTAAALPVAIRAVLSGQLDGLQQQLGGYRKESRWLMGGGSTRPAVGAAGRDAGYLVPEDWPADARRLSMACREMGAAIVALRAAQAADLRNQTSHELAGKAAADVSHGNGAPEPNPPESNAGVANNYWRRVIQSGLTTGVALGIGSIISPSYQYWAALPAYQVLGGSDGETFVRGAQRIVGTVTGATVGFAIAVYSQNNSLIVFPALLICIFLTSYFRDVSAPLTSFWQTMMFAQLYEVLGKLTQETVEIRVLETIVGAVVALLVAALVLPTRTRSKLGAEVAALAGITEGIVRTELARLEGGDEDHAKSLAAKVTALNRQLRRINATAVPLRRNSGSMETGGIEAKMTAVWSLVYYTRHLMVAVDLAVQKPGRSNYPELREVAEQLTGNLAALQTALLGGPMEDIQEDLDIPVDGVDVGDPLFEVLTCMARIQQTVLLLGANMSTAEGLGIGEKRDSPMSGVNR